MIPLQQHVACAEGLRLEMPSRAVLGRPVKMEAVEEAACTRLQLALRPEQTKEITVTRFEHVLLLS